MRTELWRSGLWKSGAAFGLAVMVGASGCKSNQTANTPAPIVDANGGPDPAAVNNAPVNGMPATPAYASSAPLRSRQPARVLGQQAYAPPPSSAGEQYPEQYPEQTAQTYPAGQGQPYPAGYNGSAGDYDAAYEQQVNAGQDALYASQPPPPLPVYAQPELTDPGDQWTPGYWSYASQGYYWVPGAWVAPPFIGALWTPGYWGFYGGRYRFNHGFWGQHIGFYGGVPYGFGYTGHGYEGGYWNGNRFFYNNAVNRVNGNVVHNVYARNVTAVNNDRVSYNGPGGWNARPTASDVAVLHEQRVPAMQVQRQRAQEAASNRQQFASENHGRPAVAVLAQRQPADRVAPAAFPPVGRQEPPNAQRPAQVGGLGPENGTGRTQPEQGRGQAGFGARENTPQPGSAGRPVQQEQVRPGNQLQPFRPQPQAQPRVVPEAQRPIQNQPRTQSPDQQRQVQDQLRQDQQRQVQDQQRQMQDQQRQMQDQQRQNQQRQLQEQRSAPNQAQPVRPQVRPEIQAQPAARPQPQVQPQIRPQPQPQPQTRPEPQSRPQLQAQPQARPQPQTQPQAHPQSAPHPEESHPHLSLH